jgi:hypothetical protein
MLKLSSIVFSYSPIFISGKIGTEVIDNLLLGCYIVWIVGNVAEVSVCTTFPGPLAQA